MEERLPTKLWLDAHLRAHAALGQSYYIVHRGDNASGTIVLKLILGRKEGCRVYSQARDNEGELAWLPAFEGRIVSETEADAYIQRLTARDPDLWGVEVESPTGTLPLPGKIL